MIVPDLRGHKQECDDPIQLPELLEEWLQWD